MIQKIASYVEWNTDTSEYFYLGVLSENTELIIRFNLLAEITHINKRRIKVLAFPSVSQLAVVHLLFVDEYFNSFFPQILTKYHNYNTLIVSDNYTNPGEIMVNLLVDIKKSTLSFEYNRANILFKGLNLKDEIVLLKGSEIEIRSLYLQVKQLWDAQKLKADSLQLINISQNQFIRIQKDSVSALKLNMAENYAIIKNQNITLSKQDSLSHKLNNDIQLQQREIYVRARQIDSLHMGLIQQKELLSAQNMFNLKQKQISDSLAEDIDLKTSELNEKQKLLDKKDTVIKNQNYALLILISLVVFILVLILILTRAFIVNKRSKQQIQEQKAILEEALETLKKTQEQLINSEKLASLGVLVSGIAHEINNPVNFINTGVEGIERVLNKLIALNNFVNTIQPGNADEINRLITFRDSLKLEKTIKMVPVIIDNIKVGIKRTIDITNGLRHYARMDKEDKSMHLVDELLQTALLFSKQKLGAHIQVIKQIASNREVPVYPGKITQVFINLIGNAVDAINETNMHNIDHKIQIDVYEITDYIIIQISDSGIGIADKDFDKLFDPFFTTKAVGKGTGLGLAISYGIINEHKGHIYAKKGESTGATFIIELPVS